MLKEDNFPMPEFTVNPTDIKIKFTGPEERIVRASDRVIKKVTDRVTEKEVHRVRSQRIDDTLEALMTCCGLPIAVGLIPTIIYKNVKMDFNGHGVVSRNVFGISKTYSWDEITKARLLYDSQYRCKIYANGQKVGSAVFSYDGYTQLLDLLIKKRLLEKSDIVEKAKRRAALSQPGGLRTTFKNKR